MELQTAIISAIEYEKKVYHVYLEAARSVGNPHAKKILEHLASEEKYHLEYLNRILEQLKSQKKVIFEQLKTTIPTHKEIEDSLSRLKKYIASTDAKVVNQDEEQNILEKALSVEQETSDFYRRMVEEMDGENQLFFKRFLEIEEGHLAIVKAELDAVSGMGFWFDWQEFDLEAG